MQMFNKDTDSGGPANANDSGNVGFLPDEYVEQRRVRRSTVFGLALLSVVLLGVAGAFVVTQTQWNEIREYGQAVDVRYKQAADNLDQLNELEAHAGTLVKKAEVVLALVERVPRSLLIAELTSAMPAQMTLTDLELKSTKVKPPAPKEDEKKKGDKKTTRKSRTSDEGPEAEDVAVPMIRSTIVLMGVAPTHQDIARYVSSLQNSDLLEGIELRVSESAMIKQREMIKFRIEGRIDPSADPRRTSREAGLLAGVELIEGGE